MKPICTLALTCLLGLASNAMAEPFRLAITVDDLPAHGSPTPDMTRVDVAKAYLAPLRAHKVPGVWGFINASHVTEAPETLAVLKLWRAAGYPLGNHGYTHMSLDTGGLEAFRGDIEKNEPILTDLMPGEDWKVVRFPYLNASSDPARHNGVMAYLDAKGYRIADVSMGFSDWAYTETYNRCLAKQDDAAITVMKAQYLNGARAGLARARYGARAVYGRDIPYVLLLHEGAFTALMLDDILSLYESEGVDFITLDDAQSDPAYRAPSPRKGNGDLIERTAQDKGIDTSGWPQNVSITNLDSLCR